jgi:hypothetical protein
VKNDTFYVYLVLTYQQQKEHTNVSLKGNKHKKKLQRDMTRGTGFGGRSDGRYMALGSKTEMLLFRQ